MKLAVFADIHSNCHALAVCVKDALSRGAEGFVLLGDFVSDLSEPRQTMDLVYELKAQYPCWCVRGNREDYMLQARRGEASFCPGSKSGSLLYTFRQLREKDFAFFESLSISCTICPGGFPIEIAHAEMDNNRHVINEDDPYLENLISQMKTRLLLAGHSHRQYIFSKNGKTILNPGSLGIPQGKPGFAQYAMVELGGGEPLCELLLVPFDVPWVIQAQYESGLAALAPCWALSILNNLISGENCMLFLLRQVEAQGDASREEIWQREAKNLNLAMTQDELLRRWHQTINNPGGNKNGCSQDYENL